MIVPMAETDRAEERYENEGGDDTEDVQTQQREQPCDHCVRHQHDAGEQPGRLVASFAWHRREKCRADR